jgi:hypothetical protein
VRIRDVTLVGIRLMAVWFAGSAVVTLSTVVQSTGVLLANPGSPSQISSMLFSTALGLFVAIAFQVGLCCGLFYFARPLASLICRDIPAEEDSSQDRGVTPHDVYRIACLLLGVYLVATAISPMMRSLAQMMSQGSMGGRTHWNVAGFVAGLIQAGLGLWVVFGSRGIARLLSSLGRDSDDVPAQQFSLRLLLILVVACAVILLILRSLG